MAIRNVLIGGGSGFIGRHLSQVLKERFGTKVTIISRMPDVSGITWDELEHQGLESNLDAVINLAGQNVLEQGKIWNSSFQQTVVTSRVETTSLLARLIDRSPSPPPVFLTISGVGVYKPSDRVYDERSHCQSFDFFSKLVHEWETASKTDKCRVVNVRTGVVLGKHGGMFQQLYWLFYFGLGAKMGSGTQYLPWIHIDDLVNIFIQAILNEQFSGVVNGVAPELVTNAQFTQQFAKAVGRPAFLTIPEVVLNAIFHPERAIFMTRGQKVVSDRMQELGYQFKYPQLQQALQHLVL